MKKTAIITGFVLLTLTAFAQRPTRERTQQETQKHKSETTVKRSAPARNQQPASRTRTSVTKEYNQATRSGSVNRNGTHRPEYTTRNTETRMQKPQTRQRVRTDHPVVKHYSPIKNRKVHYYYRSPGHINLYWTHNMYREYRIMYPDFQTWNYPIGYSILTVPAYNAYFHMGEVRNVYGRVHEVWYSWKTDEYYMYFGAGYPYQDFTVVLPGNHARRFSMNPEMYFSGRYIWVNGLVSTFDGKPEIMVMRKSQVHLY